MVRRFLLVLTLLFSTLSVFCQIDSTITKQIDILFDNYYNTPQNNPDSALIYLDSALNISKKNNYTIGITDVMREKGYIYSERGDYVKAMKILIDAIKLDEKINNKDGIASGYNLIGLLYHEQEKMNEALTYFNKARDLFTVLKDESGVAMVNANMGMIYRNLNKFEQALTCYFSALSYHQKMNKESSIANIENNIGNIYKDLKQFDKALEYFFKSKKLKTKNKLFFSLVSTLSNIGDVYVVRKEFNKASDYYNEALALAREQNSLRLQKDVFWDLSNLYKEQGNYKLAYESFKESTHLKDSIISEKYNNDIAELKVKYESDKKENENKILIKDNELQLTKTANERKQKLLFASLSLLILLAGVFVYFQYRTKKKLNKKLAEINTKIKNQNTTLKTLNKELIDSEENLTLANTSKDQLISMLSHDLYNPVTSVINYTNLTLESSEQQTKEDLQNSLKSINNAVIPLQDLLDNILQWARTQKTNLRVNYADINLHLIISDIIKLYQPVAAFKQIKIVYDTFSEDSMKSDRLMIYFILRNIVNNAVKYSPKGKEITIETQVSNNSATIFIKDQGFGFKSDILAQLNNSESTELQGQISGSGIGLSVSRKFIRLLKGKIEFGNRESGGAEIKIIFPLA